MATIKDLIDSFCYRQNLPAKTTYVGNTDPAARQYLSLFQSIGDNLRNRPYDWTQLRRYYSFLTVLNQRVYQLPGNFYRLITGTTGSPNRWLYGPITDSDYAMRGIDFVTSGPPSAFKLTGPLNHLISTSPYSQRSAGQFLIDPPGQNGTDTLSLYYLSCNWLWPRDWVTSTVYAAGDIRSGNGYMYRTAAGGTSGATRPSHSTGSASDGTVTWTVYTEPYLAFPSNTALNDADFCLFDDDLMIEGLRWAWLQSKKQPFAQERQDWEGMVAHAATRLEGDSTISTLGSRSWLEDFPDRNIPEGSWDVD